MAIYLDEQTRPYLERKFKEVKDTDFIGKRVQKMLQADRERLDTISHCAHSEQTYLGRKTCCSKCGAFFSPGHFEEWELQRQEGEPTPTKA